MELNSENVNKIFLDCLLEKNKPTDGEIICEGIMIKAVFDSIKLKKNTEDIKDLLKQTPDEFKNTKTGGGGSTFLNLCMNNKGTQWTDLHQTMEKLVLLGMGVGSVIYSLPKAVWNLLPGGMPYITIFDN